MQIFASPLGAAWLRHQPTSPFRVYIQQEDVNFRRNMITKPIPKDFESIKTTYFTEIHNLFRKAIYKKIEENIFVFPIDTGLGKSTLILNFLAGWKAEGFKNGESAIIFLHTIREIEDYVARCGLAKTDFAVVTNDEQANALGREYPNTAPIIFTTHAKLQHQTSRKAFAKCDCFYYKGKPRSLRIWDEAALRATPISLSRDRLLQLIEPLRPYYPDWVAGLEKFVTKISCAQPGSCLTVPTRFGKGKQYYYSVENGPTLTDKQAEVVKQLGEAKGKTLRVMAGKKYGTTLVGAGNRLPPDLAPFFIFDASARVVDNYKQWSIADERVRIMPALIREYSNLAVYIWKNSCGLEQMAKPDERRRCLSAIAKLINGDSKRTLLVAYKAREAFDLFAELKDMLVDPTLLEFCHWGVHHGTNRFRDIKRMVVIGTFSTRDTAYQALHMASSGIDPAEATGEEWTATRLGELRSNLLQAFSRGNIRQGEDGQCGECAIYFIAPSNPSPEALVRGTFPGCRIEPWEPFGTVLKGQAKAIVDAVASLRAAGRVGDVPKAEIRDLAGIDSEARFGNVLNTPPVKAAIAKLGVEVRPKVLAFNATVEVVLIRTPGKMLLERKNERVLAA